MANLPFHGKLTISWQTYPFMADRSRATSRGRSEIFIDYPSVTSLGTPEIFIDYQSSTALGRPEILWIMDT